MPAANRPPIDDDFDVDLADSLARLEAYNKHHYRPNTYLHKWWARRCGTTFRMILKHLVTDPEKIDFYSAGGLEDTVILDPMLGGGTTLHEAVRLGANAIGVDIDPIPIVQARASLGEVSIDELESTFADFIDDLSAKLSQLFETTCPHCDERLTVPFRYILYGRRARCDCGHHLVMDSLLLRHEEKGQHVRLCSNCHKVYRGRAHTCSEVDRRAVEIVEKTTRVCERCNGRLVEAPGPYYQRFQPVVVVGTCPHHGLFFKGMDHDDHQLACASDVLRQDTPYWSANGSPILPVVAGAKSKALIQKDITGYEQLFSSRQILYLVESIAAAGTWPSSVKLTLSLLLSTSLEFNSLLCGYKGHTRRRPGAIRHVFSHHGYTFPHTAVENNPLYPRPISGSLRKLFHDRVRRARQWAVAPREKVVRGNRSQSVIIAGEVDIGDEVSSPALLQQGVRRFWLHQGSASQIPLADDSVDFVVTDPPYFDSVHYSDLASYFHVWLRQLLPQDADWDYDRQAAAATPGIDGVGSFDQILAAIITECRRVLRQEGRLIFTFHHWNPKAWSVLTVALLRSRFQLVNRYIVHAENPMSVHISGMKALLHDAILVLAPDTLNVARTWQRPASIETTESDLFVADCATMLGWMLSTESTEEDVWRIWRETLDYHARPGHRGREDVERGKI